MHCWYCPCTHTHSEWVLVPAPACRYSAFLSSRSVVISMQLCRFTTVRRFLLDVDIVCRHPLFCSEMAGSRAARHHRRIPPITSFTNYAQYLPTSFTSITRKDNQRPDLIVSCYKGHNADWEIYQMNASTWEAINVETVSRRVDNVLIIPNYITYQWVTIIHREMTLGMYAYFLPSDCDR